MAKMEIAAKTWLLKEDAELWARSQFDVQTKCEHITNNFSESFNAWILEIRDLPIHRLVLQYTLMVMTLMFCKRVDVEDMNPYGLVPRVVRTIDRHLDDIRQYVLSGSSDNTFVVTNLHQKWWTVDLEKATCECKEWDLSGVPCIHVVCAVAPIHDKTRIPWNQFVSPFFHVSTYLRAYSGNIKPPLHEDDWCQVPRPSDVLPPMLCRRPGRPRVNRKRGRGEPSQGSKKKKYQIKCGTCNQYGHNARGCQGGPTAAEEASMRAVARAQESAVIEATLQMEAARAQAMSQAVNMCPPQVVPPPPQVVPPPSHINARAEAESRAQIEAARAATRSFAVTGPPQIVPPQQSQAGASRVQGGRGKTKKSLQVVPPIQTLTPLPVVPPTRGRGKTKKSLQVVPPIQTLTPLQVVPPTRGRGKTKKSLQVVPLARGRGRPKTAPLGMFNPPQQVLTPQVEVHLSQPSQVEPSQQSQATRQSQRAPKPTKWFGDFMPK
ncbi:hypothetical protein ACHQM5_023591 [Ranunculus cassubicifolius]